MQEPPPTDLHPKAADRSRINVRWIGLGAATAIAALVIAAMLFFKPPGLVTPQQQKRPITVTSRDDMLTGLPSDYSWREPAPALEPPAPAPAVAQAPVQLAREKKAAATQKQPTQPRIKPPLVFPAGTIFQTANGSFGGGMTPQSMVGQQQNVMPAQTPMATPRDRQEEFMFARSQDGNLYHDAEPEPLDTDACIVSAGTRIPAVLTADVVTAIAGQLTARTSYDVYDITGTCKAIPAGSQLVGDYDHQTSHGQRRVQIAWTILTTPDGETISLAGLTASDAQGAAGVGGNVKTHWLNVLGAAVLGTVIDSIPSAVGGLAGVENNLSFGGQQIASAGQQIIKREMDRMPEIQVPSGTEVMVDVRRHMAFR